MVTWENMKALDDIGFVGTQKKLSKKKTREMQLATAKFFDLHRKKQTESLTQKAKK